jgi:F420-non-reducing hydrogenase small subunit
MVKVAEEWLNICGGCEVSILDLGEKILDLLPSLEFVHMPVLMDHKYFGQTGEKSDLEIPQADIGMISGGIRNEKEKHVTEEMRKKCKTLIALGSCACFGGIPAMANMYTVEELYQKVYRDSRSTESAENPTKDLPALTDRVYAVDEVVKVDVSIPGCPMNPAIILEALTCLLEGKPFELPERSVCDDCPTKREEKTDVGLKRPLQNAEFTPGQYDKMRCLNEQGILCLGPVTRSGCGKP